MTLFRRRSFLQASAAAATALVAGRCSSAQDPKPRKVKIGQIGTVHAHAGGKMDALRRLADDFEVVGIVEPDPKAREAAQRAAVYRGLTRMSEEKQLATPGLEAVAVERDTLDLVPTAARCVAAGMHVHLEKPAGLSLPAYRALLAEAARRKRCVQMGFMFRHNPAFRLCFQAVREGWLGRVFEVHGVMSRGFEIPLRQKIGGYPGGTMLELGCHLIDAAVAVLGKPTAVRGFARSTHPEVDKLADNAVAVLEYPGALATIRSTLLEVDAGRRREFVVCGDRGTFCIRPLEPPAAQLVLASAQGPYKKGVQEVTLPKMPGRYDDHLAELARVVRGQAPPEYSPEHDLAVHEAVLLACGLPVE